MGSDPVVSRRDALKAAAGVGAAAALGAAAAPSFGARLSFGQDDRIKVGLIGCGGRGTGAAINALRADPGTRLWAVGDVFGEKIGASVAAIVEEMSADAEDDAAAAQVAARCDVPAERRFSGFSAAEKVVASRPDVVLLCTPPGFRPEQFEMAVSAGLHVFCEKPVAVDVPGAMRVARAEKLAREKNLRVMSGFCWRYQDQVKETFARLADGGIGEVHTIQTTYNTTGWIEPKARRPEWSDAEFQVRNWHYFCALSGDHIVEQAVHAIDWIAWATGDAPPERCFGVGGRMTRPDLPQTGNVWDNFAVVYEYSGGRRAYHVCRHWPDTPSDNSAYFLGSRGRCVMQPWTGEHVIEGERPWRGTAAGNDMYQREHDELFRAIRTGEPVSSEGADGGPPLAHSTLLAIMARDAAYSGGVITWERLMADTRTLSDRGWHFGPRPTPGLPRPGGLS
jgi:predicted dehydrogenase